MDWVSTTLFANTFGSVVCDWILTPDETAGIFTDPTLMTTRLRSAIRTYTAAPANAIAVVAIGIIAWDGIEDFGPAICPDPIVDGDYDWIMRQAYPVPPFTLQEYELHTEIDTEYASQAKRRLPTGTGLLWSVSTSSIGATLAADIRCLIKE
jgi:hypothetical protein